MRTPALHLVLVWSLAVTVALVCRQGVAAPAEEGVGDDAAIEPMKKEPAREKTVEPTEEELAPRKPECPPPAPCVCKEQPARAPVFVVDWAHLADLTRGDPGVLALAQNGEKRTRGASLLAHGGVGIGLAVTFVGYLRHVQTGQWSRGTELTFAGGLFLAALSAITAWNYAPDRGDMADAVNYWNQRHPDRPLAP
ncbi:MAG: hypothetical protein JXP73_21465 [Deltaproteobacteria bacterium]|jgi:hypothetical protein|nr:hypothetical protein [Deltaproteobacteria bacterium]